MSEPTVSEAIAHEHPLVNELDLYEHVITVPEAFEHPDKYTAYKIVIQATPKNALENDVVRFVQWSRYKRLNQLHLQLRTAHEQLRLRGKFPDFPKPKLFGAHDPHIISERRASAESFLQFSFAHRILSRLAVFLQFLSEFELEPEDALLSVELSSPAAHCLEPDTIHSNQNINDLLGLGLDQDETDNNHQSIREENCETTTIKTIDNVARHNRRFHGSRPINQWQKAGSNSIIPEPSTSNMNNNSTILDGPSNVQSSISHLDITPDLSRSSSITSRNETNIQDWSLVHAHAAQARQQQIENTLDNESERIDNQNWIGNQMHVLQTLAATDHSNHLQAPPLDDASSTQTGSCESLNSNRPTRDAPRSSASAKFEITDSSVLVPEVENELMSGNIDQNQSNQSPIRGRIGRFFPVFPSQSQLSTETQENTRSPMKVVRSETNVTDLLKRQQNADTSEKTQSKTSSVMRFLSRQRDQPKREPSSSRTKNNDGQDYLVQAAAFISSAQQSEADQAYELAFTRYKSAVNLLLQGVQHEPDINRRNAVRKKTAKYLLKAERIYKTFLAFDSGSFDVGKWAATVSAPSVQDPTLIAFQGDNTELSNYSFVQALSCKPHSVLLVQDRQSRQLLVLKFMDKTCHMRVVQSSANPFMTQTSENFVPIQTPHMCELIKFYETDNAVILLLKHSPLGTLYDFLADYFAAAKKRRLAGTNANKPVEVDSSDQQKSDVRNEINSQNAPDTAAKHHPVIRRMSSNYSGHRVRFSVPSADTLPETDCTEVVDDPFDLVLQGNKIRETVGYRTSVDSFGDQTSPYSTTESINASSDLISTVPETSDSTNVPGEQFSQVLHSLQSQVSQFSIIDEHVLEDTDHTMDHSKTDKLEESNNSDMSPTKVEIRPEETLKDIDSTEAWILIRRLLSVGGCWPVDLRLPENVIRQWMIDVVTALTHLHADGVLISSLGQRDLLMMADGRVQLTYHSKWNCVDKTIDWQAIKALNAAPETRGVQWQLVSETMSYWALGAIFYELLNLQCLSDVCFHDIRPTAPLIFEETQDVSREAKDLLTKLLESRLEYRLGAGGLDEIKGHPFFRNVAWPDDQ